MELPRLFGCQTNPHQKPWETIPLIEDIPFGSAPSCQERISEASPAAELGAVGARRLVLTSFLQIFGQILDSGPFRHMNFCMPVFQEHRQMTPSSDLQHEQQQKQLARCRWSAILFCCSGVPKSAPRRFLPTPSLSQTEDSGTRNRWLVIEKTCVIFHFIFLGCHPKPIDFHSIIFQRGRSTTKQIRGQPTLGWTIPVT